MSFLLDTNALLWWLGDDSALSESARRHIDDGALPVFVSSISIYEISLKVQIGKLELIGRGLPDLLHAIQEAAFQPLFPTFADAVLAGQLPLLHKDPWDRLLAAQARVGNLTILSPDTAFDVLGAARAW